MHQTFTGVIAPRSPTQVHGEIQQQKQQQQDSLRCECPRQERKAALQGGRAATTASKCVRASV